MFSQEHFKRQDNSSQIALILVVVISPLSIENVMHSSEIVVFGHVSTSAPSELLHVASNAQQQADVDAEGSNVGTSLA